MKVKEEPLSEMELQQLITVPFIFTFLLFLLILVKHRKKSSIHYPKSRLPPGPSKLPVIGHLYHMRGLPHHVLKDLSKIHGPLMYLKFGQLPVLIVSSSYMAKQITKVHDLTFADRGYAMASKILTYGCTDLALSPYGEYWRQMRKSIILQILCSKGVQSLWQTRDEVVSNRIRKISLKAGAPVNFSQEFFEFVYDINFRIGFGQTCKRKEEFLEVVKELVQMVALVSIHDIFPSLKFLEGFSRLKYKVEKLWQKTDNMLNDIIREHKANQSENNQQLLDGGLLDALLKMQEAGEHKVAITVENVKAILINLFLGGVDTTSTTLEWAFSELVRNPRVMEKAQAEVRRIFAEKENIDQADVNRLSYLKLIVKETLRLHPSAPLLLPRECREACEIGGYEIPKGTKVFINAWAIGRDPEHWSDPECFNPERFDRDDVDYNGTNFSYIPFGAGRRICPGILLATSNIELLLARLLYHFDWTIADGVQPEELDMTEELGTTMRRKSELHVIPRICHPISPGLKIMRTVRDTPNISVPKHS